MNHQVGGRFQRPARGLIIKQTLQYVLILAVYIWLFYALKQTLRREFGEELSEWSILGRQGTVGSSRYSDDFGGYEFDMIEEAHKKKDEGNDDDDEWANLIFGEEEEKPVSNGVNLTTHAPESETQKHNNEKPAGNEGALHFYDRMRAGKLPVKKHGFSGKNISTDAKVKDQENKLYHVELADGDKTLGKASTKVLEERTGMNIADMKASQETDEGNNFWEGKQNAPQDEERMRCEIDKNCTPTQRSVILTKILFQEYMSRLNPQKHGLATWHGSRDSSPCREGRPRIADTQTWE
ncbi:hypothetical protein Ancab_016854 [Ancistrocladus abbreviatus]